MRFMVLHKVDAYMEGGGPAKPEIIQAMGALVQESLRSGVFLTGAGLHPSSKRARVKAQGGHATISHGPYSGDNELLASFAMIRAASLDDAVDHARRAAELAGDADIEVGPVVEPWDLGLIPQPPNAPKRFLLLAKADAAFERGEKNTAAALADAMRTVGQDGSVLASDQLAPSSKATRLGSEARGPRTWTDGPFTESKELIAGFSILELPSRADAVAWAERYAAILGDNEVDVREMSD